MAVSAATASTLAYPLLPEVRSMLVLRPNAIGDFMFALPALHALRHAYPEAKIAFIGKRWHADFLQGRPGPIDEVMVIPPYPGVGAPPDTPLDPELNRRFISAVRAAEFDLALQMYGGGRYSNPFVSALGAKLTMGMKTRDAVPLDRWIAYSELANRRLELLDVAALAGAAPCFASGELAITENDHAAAAALIAPTAHERIVVIHPGASDPRRRWPTARFAAVADALAEKGATIVLSAVGSEIPLAQEIAAQMRHDAINLGDSLSLPALCGLLKRATLLVANDTGPLHLALALSTPSVGIFWLTNLLESGPLRQQLLRPALSVQAYCPVCGVNNHVTRCEHDVCFVDDVTTEEVLALALELFEQAA